MENGNSRCFFSLMAGAILHSSTQQTLEDIVSHGCVVAAIDHPYDTTYARFPNGDVAFFAQERFNKEVAKPPHGLSAYSNERVEVMGQDNQYALTQS
jgi:hypothetical protein